MRMGRGLISVLGFGIMNLVGCRWWVSKISWPVEVIGSVTHPSFKCITEVELVHYHVLALMFPLMLLY
jgi:hypothetical protein